MVHHVCLVRMVVRLQVVRRPVRLDHVRALVARTVETSVNYVVYNIYGTVARVSYVVCRVLEVDQRVVQLDNVYVVQGLKKVQGV